MNTKEVASKKNRTVSKKCTSTPFEASLRSYSSSTLNNTQRQVSANFKSDISPIKKRDLASTPLPISNTSVALPVCDASVIEINQSSTAFKQPFSMRKKNKMGYFHGKGQIKKPFPVLASLDETRRKEKNEDEIALAKLNLLYCKSIQAAYLVSQAKKSCKEREKFALQKLHDLWKINQVLMAQEKSLCAEVKSLKYMNEIYTYCHNEEDLLSPMLKTLPEIMLCYKEISEAIDKIRHKLHAPSIVPLDSNLQDKISIIVNEIHNLLIDFFKKIACDHSQIIEAESLLVTVKNLIGDLSEEVQRCSTLLSKSHDLVATEISLKISEINLPEHI